MRRALPHLATCGNLASGFLAVLFAASGDFFHAAAFVLAAAILDLLDGAIARNGDTGDDGLSEFGKNLDSLADVVSFGAAPAFAAYTAVLHAPPVAGIAGCLAFFVCGALRLARFPLVGGPDRFVGLPIPPAGLFVAALAALGPPPLLVLAALAATSALMVSTVPFPTPAALFGRKKGAHGGWDGPAGFERSPAGQNPGMGDEGFRELVGAELSEAGDGRAVVRLRAGARHLNPGGTVHGGAISTLVDISMAEAIGTAVAEGDERPVTVEMKVNYMSPGKPGDIASEARVRKGGKTMTVVEAEVLQEEDGEVVALATGTFTIVG